MNPGRPGEQAVANAIRRPALLYLRNAAGSGRKNWD